MKHPHFGRAVKFSLPAAATICALVTASPSSATTVADPSNDFIGTYIGPIGPGLDILHFSVTMDDSNFFISGTLDGTPGATGSRYNVGVDRGAGSYQFGAGIRPDIFVDAAINLLPATISGRVTFIGPPDVLTPLPDGSVSISNNTISAVVPISMLPSTGFAPQNYKFYFWSRVNVSPPTPLYYGIADFAPDTGSVTAVPEPVTWALMLLGLSLSGSVMRKRRNRGVPVSTPS